MGKKLTSNSELPQIIFGVVYSILIALLIIFYKLVINYFQRKKNLMAMHICYLTHSQIHEQYDLFQQNFQNSNKGNQILPKLKLENQISPTSNINKLSQSDISKNKNARRQTITRKQLLKEQSRMQIGYREHDVSFFKLSFYKIFCIYFYPIGLFKNQNATPKLIMPRIMIIFLLLNLLFALPSVFIIISQINGVIVDDFSANNIFKYDFIVALGIFIIHAIFSRHFSILYNNNLIHVSKYAILQKLDNNPKFNHILDNNMNKQRGILEQTNNQINDDLSFKLTKTQKLYRQDFLLIFSSLIFSVLYGLGMYFTFFGTNKYDFDKTLFHILIIWGIDLIIRVLFSFSLLIISLCYMKANNKDLGNRVAREYEAQLEEEYDTQIAYKIQQYLKELYIYEANDDDLEIQKAKKNIQNVLTENSMLLNQNEQKNKINNQSEFSLLKQNIDMGKDWIVPEDIEDYEEDASKIYKQSNKLAVNDSNEIETLFQRNAQNNQSKEIEKLNNYDKETFETPSKIQGSKALSQISLSRIQGGDFQNSGGGSQWKMQDDKIDLNDMIESNQNSMYKQKYPKNDDIENNLDYEQYSIEQNNNNNLKNQLKKVEIYQNNEKDSIGSEFDYADQQGARQQNYFISTSHQ